MDPSLGRAHPLEEGRATHSSILARRVPGQRRLAGYSPWGCKRVGHYRSNLACKKIQTVQESMKLELRHPPSSPRKSLLIVPKYPSIKKKKLHMYARLYLGFILFSSFIHLYSSMILMQPVKLLCNHFNFSKIIITFSSLILFASSQFASYLVGTDQLTPVILQG